MKIFLSFLEQLNSDGEDPAFKDKAPDLESGEIDFDNFQSQTSNFKTIDSL